MSKTWKSTCYSVLGTELENLRVWLDVRHLAGNPSI